jgi:transcriptional regulator with XRE-family HTH domain
VKVRELPPLCAAVKTVRDAYGDSLQKFSQRVNISMNSASRFELGKATPKDPAVLAKLFSAALEKALPEAELFREAMGHADMNLMWEQFYSPTRIATRYIVFPKTLSNWAEVSMLRLAQEYFPEFLPAFNDALEPLREILLTVLSTVRDPSRVNYRELDSQVTRLAEQKQLTELQNRKREQMK